MEEILASIKRIIAEDGEAAVHAAEKRRPARARSTSKPMVELLDDDAEEEGSIATAPTTSSPPEAVFEPEAGTASNIREEVLELTDKLDVAEKAEEIYVSKPASIVSDETATASRSALSALSALIVKPAPLADNTLEGLVREMLRPMLKEWLDSNLPDLVEAMVAKEIARITGKSF